VSNTRQRGRHWEAVAEALLRRRGLRLLARNYACRGGEIDLVMLDGPVLVFVEVRYRSRDHYGSGADTVTATKQRRIVCAARHYLARHRQRSRLPCRFDVVSIGGDRERSGGAGATLNWIQAAFEAP